jgi:formylglycine-generating enzyme required for sulfatase activity
MTRSCIRSLACGLALGLAQLAPARADDADKAALAEKAQVVFTTYCYKCHGLTGRNEGGFNVVTDLKKLVETKRVIPGDPRKSKVFKRLISEDNPMPPEFDDADAAANPKPLPRPGKEEIDVVRQWIEAGAPGVASSVAEKPREFLAESDILKAIAADLQSIDVRYRKQTRYFTITHLYNAGLNADELLTYRHGLSKLVNSLSWGRHIVVPRPIDSAETVFRIDLRDFKWDDKVWQAILAEYPYGLALETAQAKEVYATTACELPYVRADWFVFAASKPPLYHSVLQLPATDRELESKLQIDVARDIREDLVARAAFNGSGVSLENNRMIERHESDLTNGAYWKSYDCGESKGPKNFFSHPVGPGKEPFDFQHDGGEIIFNLPNGLQAYMLVTAAGKRLDVAPTGIVRDNAQPRGEVVNGISCMRCHFLGMIEKDDQIGPHVDANKAAFPQDVVATVRALYPPKAKMDEYFKSDAARFADAVKQTGASLSKSEPVFTLARKFESELDLSLAASESGLKADAFGQIVSRTPALAQTLGALLIPGGTVKRDVFVDAFPVIAREGRLGDVLRMKKDVANANTEITNSIGIKFRPIPAGSFLMGSPDDDKEAGSDEKPQHRVRISKPFYLGVYELTQAQYEAVMGKNPSWFSVTGGGKDMVAGQPTGQHPVEQVSWLDAVTFCNKLSEREGLKPFYEIDGANVRVPDWNGPGYRLPTEAEWEYACRANTSTPTAAELGEYGWFGEDSSKGSTRPVGQKKPNGFGLYDMHGNVREWCWDWYGEGYYKQSPVDDPAGPENGSDRVFRGGGWGSAAEFCRAAYRYGNAPAGAIIGLGLRLARVQSVR